MSDEEMAGDAAPADSGTQLAVALIVLTTVMLLMAFIATEKILGDRYHEGMLASK